MGSVWKIQICDFESLWFVAPHHFQISKLFQFYLVSLQPTSLEKNPSVFKLQKRAIRVITPSDYKEQTNGLFIKLLTLKFHDLVDYNIGQIMSKVHHDMLPGNALNMFVKGHRLT